MSKKKKKKVGENLILVWNKLVANQEEFVNLQTKHSFFFRKTDNGTMLAPY